MKTWLTTAITCLLIVVSFNMIGQNSSDYILKIDNEKVSKEDFESIFKKNNRDSVTTTQSLDEYMELFINFKLKVMEAKELGLDTNQAFIKELSGYRKQLARPYLVDKELLDNLIEEAYNRKKQEVRASHILIQAAPDATPADTLKAYQRIEALRARIISGEKFEDVARSKGGSQDPSVKTNGGDLGYFTVFQMVYPFECAAYTTPVGEVSQPIRTRFGYHIVKVTDKRDARGEIKVNHILVRNKTNADANAKKAVELKIREIHQLLKDGGDFADLANKFSEDASSARKGGELPWFGAGKMVEEFEDAAFLLTENGQISEPFETDFGWHIAQRVDYRPVPEFDEVKSELKNRISRDSRSDRTKTSFVAKLKDEYSLSVNEKCFKPFYAAAEVPGIWKSGFQVKKAKKLLKTFYTLDGKEYNAEGFYNYLQEGDYSAAKLQGKSLIDGEFETFINKEMIKYEDGKLESKYNDFRLLMNEYRDGILLFELTDQKVWSKAVKDSVGLESFYQANTDKFMWNTRANVNIYACADDKIAKELRKQLKKDKAIGDIMSQINERSSLNLSVQKGLFEEGEVEVLDQVEWKKGLSDNFNYNGQVYVVEFLDIITPTPKKLTEARGLITAEYQNHLEAQWIEELRAKHTFEVNEDVLHSIK